MAGERYSVDRGSRVPAATSRIHDVEEFMASESAPVLQRGCGAMMLLLGFGVSGGSEKMNDF
ncbi:hypothetical protein C2S52_014104 [Perilla frutescens var. hirtella]|nr:hypothetical protein C2S51_016323 [Perilla frutescens var. frutescens]KAH6776543.1 hypothetical protein C2S52_014104 [Perilla frutescens var. hirtella]